jgi:predicted transcriptional regulator
METVEVLAQGSAVIIGENIEATITAVTLRDQNIFYEVVWWDGRIRRCEWLQRKELKVTGKGKTIKIGFNDR